MDKQKDLKELEEELQKNKDKMFGIALIPDKNDEFTLSKEDGLIALAEDES